MPYVPVCEISQMYSVLIFLLLCFSQKLAKDVQTALAKANSIAEETISAIKTVRSFANEETEANAYSDKLQRLYCLYKNEAVAYTYYIWSTGVSKTLVTSSHLV